MVQYGVGNVIDTSRDNCKSSICQWKRLPHLLSKRRTEKGGGGIPINLCHVGEVVEKDVGLINK